MNIKIKQSPLKNNRSSLCLEVYAQGKTKIKGLGMFIYQKPSTVLEKEHNKVTMLRAESIKAKRILEMQEGDFDINLGFRSQGSFIEYFFKLVRERRKEESNYGNWLSAYKHLVTFCGGKELRFCDCNEAFVKNFKNYLMTANLTKSNTQLSINSVISYLNKLKAALTQAFNDKYILENPGKRIKSPPPVESDRKFLYKEEIEILAKTPCSLPILRNAFLFSCYTGLRWSDINKLTWNEVISPDGKWEIHFRQKKTRFLQYHPISEEAYSLLGERRGDDERVFKGLRYSAWTNHLLQQWVTMDAGIRKKISFHCARHTYATLLLSSGGDIYTVSKLLGHKDLKTTEIYGKIINSKKDEVVNLLPKINFV